MRISDWSSDVCSDLLIADRGVAVDAEIAVVVPVIIRIEAEGVGVARRLAVEMTIAGGQCQAAVIVMPAHAGADFGTALATDGETRRGVENGRASGRGRVARDGDISGVAITL